MLKGHDVLELTGASRKPQGKWCKKNVKVVRIK
jgi:hypothetical protein